MMQAWALLLPIAGLFLSILLLLVVLYATLFRLAHDLMRCLFCQPPKNVPVGPVSVIRSVKVHGLQLDSAGAIIIPDNEQYKHQQEVCRLFETYGTSNANVYSAFSNQEMEVFLVPGIGCLLYTVANHWGRTVVTATGDPICDPQHTLLVLQLFKQAVPGAIFIDLSKPVAQLLAQDGDGMNINDLGMETVIDVQKFHFEFNKKTKHIRRRAEVAAKAGLMVEEVTADSSPAIRQEVQQMALEWQQGKVCSDDIKVFSRSIPFEHLGQERGTRVFIARTLNPGEAVPAPSALAAALIAKKEAATAAAAGIDKQAQDCIMAADAPLSRKQRKLRERIQRAKSLRQASSPSDSAAAAADGQQADQQQLPGQRENQQQQDVTATAAAGSAAEAKQDAVHLTNKQQGLTEAAGAISNASKTGDVILDVSAITVDCRQAAPESGSASPTGSSNSAVAKAARRSYHSLSVMSTTSEAATNTTSSFYSSCSDTAGALGPSSSARIHACVVLDPIYEQGQVVGYTAERSFLHPRGVKGAVKLVLREALALLQAEGRKTLNLGLAVCYELKPGSYHGFTDCAWMTRTFRLCYQFGNDLYAFRNLAHTKACWGGGYDPQTDSYKFHEAVAFRRRFAALPVSWRWQFGDGPFNMTVMFRHFGVLGDPWELFAFWRFMGSSKTGPVIDSD